MMDDVVAYCDTSRGPQCPTCQRPKCVWHNTGECSIGQVAPRYRCRGYAGPQCVDVEEGNPPYRKGWCNYHPDVNGPGYRMPVEVAMALKHGDAETVRAIRDAADAILKLEGW